MPSLLETAKIFLEKAQEELRDGLASGDQIKIRDAMEKAWNAVVQATDYAMSNHGRIPLPGRDAHRDRRDFLEQIGRFDLAEKYTYFAERLHGDIFYGAASMSEPDYRHYLDEVEAYIRQIEMT